MPTPIKTNRKDTLHMRCYAEDKSSWRGAAKRESLQLAPWVVRTLNKEVNRLRVRQPE